MNMHPELQMDRKKLKGPFCPPSKQATVLYAPIQFNISLEQRQQHRFLVPAYSQGGENVPLQSGHAAPARTSVISLLVCLLCSRSTTSTTQVIKGRSIDGELSGGFASFAAPILMVKLV